MSAQPHPRPRDGQARLHCARAKKHCLQIEECILNSNAHIEESRAVRCCSSKSLLSDSASFLITAPAMQSQPLEGTPFWLDAVKHNGRATYNPSPSDYKVFRNVTHYGAVGE